MRNPATIAAAPAQEAITALWDYSRTRWVESAAWRRTVISLAVVVALSICHFLNMSVAMADDGGGAGANTFFLDLSGQTDTQGIGVWRYTTLPLDYGGITTPGRMIRGIILRFFWLVYTVGLFLILALIKFILDFTWLEWLLSPVILLTNTVRELFGQAGIMTLGLSISALVIAIGFLRGKKSAAIVEFFAVILVFGIASAPAIGNPTQLFEGEGSWIQNSRDYGVEAGNLTTTDETGATAISGNPVSAALIDQTLRRPTQYVSFGSQLQGDCAAIFDEKMTDGTDAEGIRKAVNRCSDEAKTANETDGWEAIGVLAIFASGTTGIMALVGVFVFFIIKDTTLALLGLVNVVIRAHLAVFPGGGRYAFINAFGQMIVNIVMVGLYIWMLSAYLWLVNLITGGIPEAALVMGNFIFAVVIVAMIFTFLKLKKSGKNFADLFAKALGKSGLSNPATPRQASNLVKSIANTGQHVLGNKLSNRGAKAISQPGQRVTARDSMPASANSGTPPVSKRGPASLARLAVAAGSAATSGGTSLALQAASTVMGAAQSGAIPMGAGSTAEGGPGTGTSASSAGVAMLASAAKVATSGTAGAGNAVVRSSSNAVQAQAQSASAGMTSHAPAGLQHTPASSNTNSAANTAAAGVPLRQAQNQDAGVQSPRRREQAAGAGPLEGKIVDRVPRDVRRIPVYQAPAPDVSAPARRNAGLVRQPPPSVSGIVRG